ncbi:hypothetical protein HQQ81_04775 [Microbacteriaceae bacterium VKM Ac-2854]|nr:hypothetical protein [Microbacteriaceae bacterium VKM Ac-2854]
MSDTAALYKRLIRRETHSPKSVLAIVLASILILLCLWLGTELVLSLLGQPALLVAPADLLASVGLLDGVIPAVLAAIGIVVALIGLVLVIAAFSSGRRARHSIDTERVAIVVDNEVIASALARHASAAGNVSPDNARVSVSHRRAEVHLLPASGTKLDRDRVESAVDEQLTGYGLKPVVRSKVVVNESGRVGA